MTTNYWHKTLARRLSRRRALTISGSAALGAAFLAACGSDGDGDGGGGDKSGLVAKAEDTTRKATVGGTLDMPLSREPTTLDALNNGGSSNNNQSYSYSKLGINKVGNFERAEMGSVELDLAEAFEVAPDGLRIVVKLRNDAKFDPRPPTNGRLLNAEDVKFSWDKYSTLGLTRSELSNAISPDAPIKSLEVMNSNTFAFNMAFPMSNMLSRFAFHRYLHILPVEADGQFDPKTTARGTGPWMLREWQLSAGMVYDRSPHWHLRKGQPFFDTMNMPLIPEFVARRAQLIQGSLLTSTMGSSTVDSESLPNDQVISLKTDQPKLNLYSLPYPVFRQYHIIFGWNPGNPWQDVRARRAVSMLLDRDLWIDSFFNVPTLESQGFAMDTRWNSHFSAGDPQWVDPKGTGLGEGASNFKHNVDEATKLMRAAGFTSAVEISGKHRAGRSVNEIQTFQQMLETGGLFKVALQSLNAQEDLNIIANGKGLFDGLGFLQTNAVGGDIDLFLAARFNVPVAGTGSNFPQVFPWYEKSQTLIDAQRRELDDKKRQGQLADLQKEWAVQVPFVPWPGQANGFAAAWPQVANFNVHSSQTGLNDPSEVYPYWWLDKSKAPA